MVTSISGVARLLMGLIFIVLAFVIVVIMKQPPAQAFTVQNLTPKFNWAYFATFAWILQAVGGAESIGVYIKDLKGGNQAFIRTMIFSALFVGIMYALGCIAIGMIIPASILENNYSNAIYDAFNRLAAYFGIQHGLTNVVGAILFLSTAGSVVLWASAPVKVFFSEAPRGILPDKVIQLTEDGTPVNALYLQAVVVSVILLIPGLGIGGVDHFLKFLINMTAATALLPVLFFVVAYINLRKNLDKTPRTFKLSQSPGVGIACGILLLILFIPTFIVSILPDMDAVMLMFQGQALPEGIPHPLFSVLYQLGGVVIFLGYAFWLWHRYEKKKLHQH